MSYQAGMRQNGTRNLLFWRLINLKKVPGTQINLHWRAYNLIIIIIILIIIIIIIIIIINIMFTGRDIIIRTSLEKEIALCCYKFFRSKFLLDILSADQEIDKLVCDVVRHKFRN